MADRRHTAALGAFTQAGVIAPDRAEPDHARARALFRMESYEEVADVCATVFGKEPAFYPALPVCWAARLEAAGNTPSARSALHTELDRWRTGTPLPPPLAVALATGYGYLDAHRERAEILLDIAPAARGTDAANAVANALFAALHQDPDPERRRRLAWAGVEHFPQRRMAHDATRALLQAPESYQTTPGEALAEALLMLPDAGRHVKAAVARHWIGAERNPRRAITLLEECLGELVAEPSASVPMPTVRYSWQAEGERDRMLYRYLLGRAWLLHGDRQRAEDNLLQVVDSWEHGADAEHFLGVIAAAEGRYDQAIERLKGALERSGRRDESAELLADLLAHRRDFRGSPQDYFRRSASGTRFVDATADAGLTGVGAQRVAWGDVDGDGHDDLLLDGGRLFRNSGAGTFQEVTAAMGLPDGGGANGGTWADFDDDGDLDLITTSRHGCRLWENDGGERLLDRTPSALAGIERLPTEASAWGDMDNDGDLDIYLANYERDGVTQGLGTPDQLLRNEGNGHFTDVSVEAGVVSEEPMCGRGATWTDLDGDGRQEIVVANYRLDPNFLWARRGDGTFGDVAGAKGFRGHNRRGAFGHSIGVAAGDLDGDGNQDLVLSNLAHPRYFEFSDLSAVLINAGPPEFRLTEGVETPGIAFEETSSDTAVADVDGDGDLDLYFTSIYPRRESHLYLNDGTGRFSDATWLSGTRAENSWGAAFSDYDGDGDSDLLVASQEGVRLFRNESPRRRWVAVRVADQHCNRFGVGARVLIRYGGKHQVREITAGRGTGSQDSLTLIFGLDDHRGPVEIEATTLCGDTLRAELSAPDQTVVLTDRPE